VIGDITKNKTPLSAYQPTEDIRLVTKAIKDDYSEGVDILNTSYVELNDRSVIEDENRGKLMFNAFVDETEEDPNEAWKWRGTRSMARNKGIAMHANLTASFLLPIFIAQNEDDEIDRDFSEAMRDIIEWMAEPTNSDYQASFLQLVFAMETNPVTFMGAEYCEIYQKIRVKQSQGYTTKEIVDDVLSGFQAPLWSSSQVLITNVFERNIQKQRRIIKRRYTEYQELEAKYGDHENWQYVQQGIKSVYNEEDGLFYDVKDEDHPNLIAEEIAYSRRDDSEFPLVNGIYLGDENVEWNPIKHRDNRDTPKYNVTPFGYSRIGEHFFYFKSMMNAVGWDNQIYDAMSEVVMNNAFLEQDPPTAVYGTDQIDSSLNIPGKIFATEDKEVKAQAIFPSKNFIAGFNALRETEKSIDEGTVSKTISGQLPEASQKAYTVAQAQSNAKKLIGGVAKTLAWSIAQYGDLMKDIAITKIATPQVEELIGGTLKLKYKQLLLENRVSGKEVRNKRIKFDPSLENLSLSKEEIKRRNVALYEEAGDKETLQLINPVLLAKYKYLTKVDVEEMFVKNAEYMQPLLTNLYTMLSNDPMIEREALLRKLLYSYFQSDGENLIRKEPLQLPGQTPDSTLGRMAQNKQLGNVVTGAVQ